jgi:hypothetical protein
LGNPRLMAGGAPRESAAEDVAKHKLRVAV